MELRIPIGRRCLNDGGAVRHAAAQCPLMREWAVPNFYPCGIFSLLIIFFIAFLPSS